MPSSQTIFIGEHRVVFLPPDLVRVEYGDALSEIDVTSMNDTIDGWFSESSAPLYQLLDTSRLTRLDALARRSVANWIRRRPGTVFAAAYGSSFSVVVLGTLMNKVAKLYGLKHELRFFTAELQAMTWLKENGANAL